MRDGSINLKRTLVLGLTFLLSIPVVLADIFDDILGPFSGVDFGATYANYAMFIDGILYFLIFFGLSRFVFEKKFGSGGKTMYIGIALALSFAAAYFGSSNGFRLGMLGPYAILIVFLLLFYLIFSLTKNMGASKWLAFSLAFLLVIYLVHTMLWGFIDENPTLVAVIGTAYIVAFIGVIFGIFSLFKGIKGGGGIFQNATSDANNMQQQQKNSQRERDKEIKKTRQESAKVLNDLSSLQQDERALQEVFNSIQARQQNPAMMEMQDTRAIKSLTEQMIKEVNTIAPVVERMEAAANNLADGKVPEEQQQAYQEWLNRNNEWLRKAFAILPGQISQVMARLKHLQEIVLTEDTAIKKERQILSEHKVKLDRLVAEMTTETKWTSKLSAHFHKAQDFTRKLQARWGRLMKVGDYSGFAKIFESKNWEQKMIAYLNSFSTFRNQLRNHYTEMGKEAKQILEISKIDVDNLKEQNKLLTETEQLVGQITQALNNVASDPKKKNMEALKTKLESLQQKTEFEAHKLESHVDLENRTKNLLANAAHADLMNKQLEKEEANMLQLLSREVDFDKDNDPLVLEFLENYMKRQEDISKGEPWMKEAYSGTFVPPKI